MRGSNTISTGEESTPTPLLILLSYDINSSSRSTHHTYHILHTNTQATARCETEESTLYTATPPCPPATTNLKQKDSTVLIARATKQPIHLDRHAANAMFSVAFAVAWIPKKLFSSCCKLAGALLF